MIIKVMLNPRHSMNYHSHAYRDETWHIITGEGEVVLDGKARKVCPGDCINIPRGTKHTLRAITALCAIEIQTGKDISADDKIKCDLG